MIRYFGEKTEAGLNTSKHRGCILNALPTQVLRNHFHTYYANNHLPCFLIKLLLKVKERARFEFSLSARPHLLGEDDLRAGFLIPEPVNS